MAAAASSCTSTSSAKPRVDALLGLRDSSSAAPIARPNALFNSCNPHDTSARAPSGSLQSSHGHPP